MYGDDVVNTSTYVERYSVVVLREVVLYSLSFQKKRRLSCGEVLGK